MNPTTTVSISCDDCLFRCSTACDDCVVTFVLATDDQMAGTDNCALVFDLHEQRVMRWFNNAGLLPALQFDQVG